MNNAEWGYIASNWDDEWNCRAGKLAQSGFAGYGFEAQAIAALPS
jgi:hypothetical protein